MKSASEGNTVTTQCPKFDFEVRNQSIPCPCHDCIYRTSNNTDFIQSCNLLRYENFNPATDYNLPVLEKLSNSKDTISKYITSIRLTSFMFKLLLLIQNSKTLESIDVDTICSCGYYSSVCKKEPVKCKHRKEWVDWVIKYITNSNVFSMYIEHIPKNILRKLTLDLIQVQKTDIGNVELFHTLNKSTRIKVRNETN